MLADADIPFAPVVPAAQVILLVFIIGFEGWYLSQSVPSGKKGPFWFKVTVANLCTAFLGAVLILPVVCLEVWLVFGWGSHDREHPVLWYVSCALYEIILPWIVWFLCYQISWRTEAAILGKWIADSEKPTGLRHRVMVAHRWSYALFGILVIAESAMLVGVFSRH